MTDDDQTEKKSFWCNQTVSKSHVVEVSKETKWYLSPCGLGQMKTKKKRSLRRAKRGKGDNQSSTKMKSIVVVPRYNYCYLIVVSFLFLISCRDNFVVAVTSVPRGSASSRSTTTSWWKRLIPNNNKNNNNDNDDKDDVKNNDDIDEDLEDSSYHNFLRFATNPFFYDDEDDVAKTTIGEVLPPLAGNIATTLYGMTLLWNTAACTGQLRTMTMIRATGTKRWEELVAAAKKNAYDASWTAVQRVPSFYLASRSMKQFDNRIVGIRKLIEATKKAKADGVITPEEARTLQRQRRHEIKLLKRDMRRLASAGKHIVHIIQALDVGELVEIGQKFAFQLLTVLSVKTGLALAEEDEEEKLEIIFEGGDGKKGKEKGNDGNDAAVAASKTATQKSKQNHHQGLLLFNSCLFQNLASMALEVNTKLDFPIASTVLKCTDYVSSFRFGKNKNEDESHDDDGNGKVVDEKKLKQAGTVITYGISGYLVVVKHTLARKLNNALLSASVVVRGLKGIVQTLMLYWDIDEMKEEENEYYFSSYFNKFINTYVVNKSSLITDASDENKNKGLLPSLNRFLHGRGGGILTVTLTAISLVLRHLQGKELQYQYQHMPRVTSEQMRSTITSPSSPESGSKRGLSIILPQQQRSSLSLSATPPQWIQSFHNSMENGIGHIASSIEDAL